MPCLSLIFFFFNDTATTEIYTLSLHDALPISLRSPRPLPRHSPDKYRVVPAVRSEEHTSELQSRENLVCRLLLEKKKLNIFNLAPSLDHHKPCSVPHQIKRALVSRRSQLM